MGFGGNKPSSVDAVSETQTDIVNSVTPIKMALKTEEIRMPGVGVLHTLGTEQLTEFFKTLLKIRLGIFGIDYKLGSYLGREVECKIPGADRLATLSVDKAATVIAAALMSNPCIVGIRVILQDTQQDQKTAMPITSRIFLKLADREPQGEEDMEFEPTLYITAIGQ